MSDDEDYNSEEDADYVPSDGELGSEEENSGDEEDLSVLADDAGTATEKSGKKSKSKKDSKGNLLPRKRKGGIKLEDEVMPTGETYGESEENKELADKLKQEAEEKKTEKEKKKAEDLWASFLSDVKPHTRPAAKATPSSSTATTQASSSRTSSQPQKSSTAAPNSSSGSGDAKSGSEKITITKVFDFAGEEIKVTKQVDANSKEAKAELKKQEKEQQEQKEQAQQRLQAATSSSSLDTSSSPSLSNILGVKRPAAPPGGGLGGILSKIGKKQKMGTLEKSKMDWDSFKKKEGIEEDLKIHNKGKDGYIERMAFLNRADVRQYEIERDLRLSKTGKR